VAEAITMMKASLRYYLQTEGLGLSTAEIDQLDSGVLDVGDWKEWLSSRLPDFFLHDSAKVSWDRRAAQLFLSDREGRQSLYGVDGFPAPIWMKEPRKQGVSEVRATVYYYTLSDCRRVGTWDRREDDEFSQSARATLEFEQLPDLRERTVLHVAGLKSLKKLNLLVLKCREGVLPIKSWLN
jgi:hypothetical protein